MIWSCVSEKERPLELAGIERNNGSTIRLFELLKPDSTGINFVNYIKETPQLNYYTFRHMYIGGGVATADFNNDGLIDVFFTGNMSSNKLYINKGGLQFEDVTNAAGVQGSTGFYMGVTTLDINNDGWLDIYVCKSGKYADPRLKANLLYVNNGDLTFTEKAKEYGLDDMNQSVQAAFFDYDIDGDLDVFIVNTPVDFTISQRAMQLDYIYNNKDFRKLGGNDKLYRNDGNNKFVDVTAQAGILPDLGFGLSVSISDFNGDDLPDIFVANDFIAPDYLYINQGDGSFKEKGKSYLKHTSFYSMGSDASDLNNDCLPDLMVLDMNPEDYIRSKTTMEMMDPDLFNRVRDAGYNNIFMHNMLNINTGRNSFSEISQFAGLANTDWSWSTLVADYDNDGFKDVHITNGIYRDVLDRDLRNNFDEYAERAKGITAEDIFKHLQSFPSQKLSNYIYRNNDGHKFSDLTHSWGVEEPSFSNGSAFADLDNDGDLEIIINNLMDTAFIFENKAESLKHNYLNIELKGSPLNRQGVGAKIFVQCGKDKQLKEVFFTNGYLSSSNIPMHFGVGLSKTVSRVTVTWPDGKHSVMNDINVNQTWTIDYNKAVETKSKNPRLKTILVEDSTLLDKAFFHEENDFDDYSRQVLLPYKYSTLGPKISVGDVNGDQLEDFHVGGAAGQPGALYIQTSDGKFENKVIVDFIKDKVFEDLGATFFDSDGDGDLDLYVSSGSYELQGSSNLSQDRLYQNDGKGRFKKADNLPEIRSSTSVVLPVDYDKDGDLDLFVGGRIVPGAYPLAPESYILTNNKGSFVNTTENHSSELLNLGMVTDGVVMDYDRDGFEDLILVGEWMRPAFLRNKSGKGFETAEVDGQPDTGWWQSILSHDFDKDGKSEIVFGNLGLNTKHKASKDKPFHIYASDFDKNNVLDAFLAKNIGGREVPVRGRECSAQQIPQIAERFKTFDSFAKADIDEILGEQMDEALHLSVTTFETEYWRQSEKSWVKASLPNQVNFSAALALDYLDVNGDDLDDLIIAGNIFDMEVETTRLDAGTGYVLLNQGNGQFKTSDSFETGFFVQHNVKDIAIIRNASGTANILVAENNGYLRAFRFSN
ncbi:MAG: VCBS repeat-containing protein [Bacteroidota bacterium]